MKFFLLSCLFAMALCRPEPPVEEDYSIVEELEAEDSDLEFNKELLKEMMKTMKDPSVSQEDKHAKFQETVDQLKGEYKEKFEQLVADVKQSVSEMTNKEAKDAAETMIEAFENGDVFGDKEEVKALAKETLSNLSEEAMAELKGLQKTYEPRFKEEFKALRPEHEHHGFSGPEPRGPPNGGAPSGLNLAIQPETSI